MEMKRRKNINTELYKKRYPCIMVEKEFRSKAEKGNSIHKIIQIHKSEEKNLEFFYNMMFIKCTWCTDLLPLRCL